jgi:hypothetical protein
VELKWAAQIEETATQLMKDHPRQLNKPVIFTLQLNLLPGIYDKCHPDYARQGKIDLAWERISHVMKESGSWLRSFETVV